MEVINGSITFTVRSVNEFRFLSTRQICRVRFRLQEQYCWKLLLTMLVPS